MTKMKQLKETYISDFLQYCSDSEVITNEFLLKVEIYLRSTILQ